MARYKRIPQKIGDTKTLTAHRDFADICPGCGDYILRGQMYTLKGDTAWHYRCKGLTPQVKPEPKAPARPVKQRTPEQEQKRQAYKARKRQEKAERRAEQSRLAKKARRNRARGTLTVREGAFGDERGAPILACEVSADGVVPEFTLPRPRVHESEDGPDGRA